MLSSKRLFSGWSGFPDSLRNVTTFDPDLIGVKIAVVKKCSTCIKLFLLLVFLSLGCNFHRLSNAYISGIKNDKKMVTNTLSHVWIMLTINSVIHVKVNFFGFSFQQYRK